MKVKYKKPKITSKKIAVNMFRSKFIDTMNNISLPLFAAGTPSAGTSGCSCTCFLKETKIYMADGTTEAIEIIKAGDMVFSYNIDSKKLVENKVLELIIHEKATEGYLIINDILKVTPEHNVYLNDKWQPIGNVKVGDSLINSSGEKVPVLSVERINEEVGPVYNLHLEKEEHNYFAENILVHNSKTCLSFSTKIATPFGNINVRKIYEGQMIWTINLKGERVLAPVIKVSKTLVSKTHQVCHLILDDGRELFVTLYHPTILGGSLADLRVGQMYDGSVIKSLDLIPYKHKYTYDILPAGGTGFYWANDILMESTLKNLVSENKSFVYSFNHT